MSTMEKYRFERTCTVRELIMALRAVADHNALVKVDPGGGDICRIELTDLGIMRYAYLCIGHLPAVSLQERQEETES